MSLSWSAKELTPLSEVLWLFVESTAPVMQLAASSESTTSELTSVDECVEYTSDGDNNLSDIAPVLKGKIPEFK